MNFKKSQSGRSMVEMLGVLAIIGVLSVGGIAGYSLSMRRHRANQVVDLVSKLAVTAYTECQKQVLDGTLSDVSGCSRPHMTAYYQEDGTTPAGALPANVAYIVFPQVKVTDNGAEVIQADLQFTDKKLCQAVASVAGSTCEGTGLSIDIKQN